MARDRIVDISVLNMLRCRDSRWGKEASRFMPKDRNNRIVALVFLNIIKILCEC